MNKANNKKTKKALFVIAFDGFQDIEYQTPLDILKEAGIETYTTSNKSGVAVGAYYQTKVKIEKAISEIDSNDYDAIIFVGGPGALENLDNYESYKIIIQTVYSKSKIIAAICIAPIILSNAGILKGKNATVWKGEIPKTKGARISTIELLEDNGAIYNNQNVVVDGNIITANGPTAAQKFGETILSFLR